MESCSRCPICASDALEELSRSMHADAQDAEVVRCKSCGYIYQPTPSRIFLQDAPAQESTAPSSQAEPIPDDVLMHWLLLIERAVARGALLDIGSGTGRFLDLARYHGWRVAGIESSMAMEQAQNIHRKSSTQTRACEGIWPAGCFDVVTIWGALEQHDTPDELLRLAAHYCRVDGVLVVQVLNGEHITDEKRSQPAGEPSQDRPPHVFTSQALQQLLGRFGFRAEIVEHSNQLEMGVTSHSLDRRRIFFPLPPHTMRKQKGQAAAEILTVVARFIP